METRETLEEYSWEELAAISDRIGKLDAAAALEYAKDMNLISESGRFEGAQNKHIMLATGQETSASIIGIAHDALVGRGSGSAGLTFMFDDAIAMQAMNNDAGFVDIAASESVNTYGGWCASEVRTWLNSVFLDLLPADLEPYLSTVEKNGIAAFSIALFDDDSPVAVPEELIETTCDKLWLPAVIEIADKSDLDIALESPAIYQVLEMEGRLYQRFAENKTARVKQLLSADGNLSQTKTSWWLRSPIGGSFARVEEDGTVDCYGMKPSGSTQGITACFCI